MTQERQRAGLFSASGRLPLRHLRAVLPKRHRRDLEGAGYVGCFYFAVAVVDTELSPCVLEHIYAIGEAGGRSRAQWVRGEGKHDLV